MVVTTDFYLQVVYICSLKVTHGGNYRLLPTSGVHMFSQGHSWWQNSGLLYIWKKISQGHSWWQNSRLIYIYIYIYFSSLKVTHGGKTTDFYRYTYVLSRSLMVAKLPTFIYGKKQFSQGHSWWQNSRLSRSLMVAKSSQLLYLVYIYMFSQNWYTTNEKEHIAHHIKHFEVSPKKQGKLRTKFVRSFQKH